MRQVQPDDIREGAEYLYEEMRMSIRVIVDKIERGVRNPDWGDGEYNRYTLRLKDPSKPKLFPESWQVTLTTDSKHHHLCPWALYEEASSECPAP